MTTTVDPAQIEINKHTPRHVHDAFADVSQLDRISGNPRSRSSSSPANTCVATATSQSARITPSDSVRNRLSTATCVCSCGSDSRFVDDLIEGPHPVTDALSGG